MCALPSVALVSVYVASMGALLWAMYILHKDSKISRELYKGFLEKDGKQ